MSSMSATAECTSSCQIWNKQKLDVSRHHQLHTQTSVALRSLHPRKMILEWQQLCGLAGMEGVVAKKVWKAFLYARRGKHLKQFIFD